MYCFNTVVFCFKFQLVGFNWVLPEVCPVINFEPYSQKKRHHHLTLSTKIISILSSHGHNLRRFTISKFLNHFNLKPKLLFFCNQYYYHHYYTIVTVTVKVKSSKQVSTSRMNLHAASTVIRLNHEAL